ncbi:MAG: NAD-dependent epimerase/dehydratase family protein [Anaerolineae bacterium]|jgi:dihydroflavonol-4-reductase|nr:NAD-dependent epimerase/dehydratase family protein [Anaerolineae bacterium]
MILVTGATGHLGNVLVRNLVLRGARVRALVLPCDRCTALDTLEVEPVRGSVLDPESLDRAMHGVDSVYHLAAIISIVTGAETLMHRVNVEGVVNVASAALRNGVNRLVHVGSVHAFKRMPHGQVINEETPLALDSAAGTYDETKARGVAAMLDAVKQGLDAVVACPSAIIGPYDFLQSLLGKALSNFARHRVHLLVPGAYDFVDVRDVADGLIAAHDRGRTGEIYIVSGHYATLAEAKAIVQEAAGFHSGQIVLPWKLALAIARVMQHVYRMTKATPQFTPYSLRTLAANAQFSSAKAAAELGYRSRSLLETARDLLAWRQAFA